MVVVDSTVWIDYIRGKRNPETDYLDREMGRERFALTDLILCEVLQGIQDEGAFARVLDELHRFEIFDSGGEMLAIEAARNFRELRQKRHTVRKTIDCLIATFCIRNGHILLHRDRDFDAFENFLGLRVVRP
ncbi:MAG: PIN domain nuclease [Candidatus Acidiferrales bacterium]